MLQFFLSCTILMFYFIFCFFYISFVHSFHVATFFVLHSFRVAIFFVLHSFDVAIFYVLQSFHVAPSFVLGSFHVAPSFLLHIFFYSTLFMLQFFMLHILQFKPALLNCFTLFMVPFFAAAFPLTANFSHYTLPCRTRFMLYLFSLVLFSCCTLFIMHSPMAVFHAAFISYCSLLKLHFFVLRSFHIVPFHFYAFSHVALFKVVLSSCYIF